MAPSTPPPLDQIDPVRAWQPWEPDSRDPWDLKWAGHLYRRAAFGASLAELRAAERRGLPATLDLLLNGQPEAASLKEFMTGEGAKVARGNNVSRLRGWWLWCMWYSGHPLREKLTLFWHNHFATSIAKVGRPTLMFKQNCLLREHALGKFSHLLLAMCRDPAMLIWLDSNSNVKGRPNENFAREVMELFSLGVGNYTEKDVREAARAFTGFHTDGDDFEFNPRFHDDGPKTVLGQTGNWSGGDVIYFIIRQPAAARFVVRKLYRFFISEAHDPPDRLLEPLAESFRRSDYDVAALVRTLLSSRHFFSAHAFRQRIKSPVEFVLGAVKAVVDGEFPQQVLVNRLEAMGQALFAPPNVKGWREAESWLNTSTVLARDNFAQALATGTLWKDVPQRGGRFVVVKPAPSAPGGKKAPALPEEPPPRRELDPARIIHAEKVSTAEDVVRLLIDAYLPGGIRASARERLVAFVAEGRPTGPALDRRVREAVHALLSMPEYQMA